MLTPDEYDELNARRLVLSLKKPFRRADRDELRDISRRIQEEAGDLYSLHLDKLVQLDPKEQPDWFPAFLRDKCWTWTWWAEQVGESLEEHVERSSLGDRPALKPETIAYIKAVGPFPKDWMPPSVRPVAW